MCTKIRCDVTVQFFLKLNRGSVRAFNIENLLQPDKDQVPTNLNTSLPRTEKGYLHGSTDNPAKKR